LKVNLFDADVGAAPPWNPAQIPDQYGWGASGSDRVWGFNRARDTKPTGPTCYPGGTNSGAAECAPCNVVRGRVAEDTDYVATDQDGEVLVHRSVHRTRLRSSGRSSEPVRRLRGTLRWERNWRSRPQNPVSMRKSTWGVSGKRRLARRCPLTGHPMSSA